ncbi:MAG: hypothetical protein K6C95_08630 [Lachnospiraceae bacterium]|nr:hypothetical protein [Lachnospiraceae bacterium]
MQRNAKRLKSILGTCDLSGSELYTTGEPCPMCLAACMWANIDKICKPFSPRICSDSSIYKQDHYAASC